MEMYMCKYMLYMPSITHGSESMVCLCLLSDCVRRYCFQCGKLEEVELFDDDRR